MAIPTQENERAERDIDSMCTAKNMLEGFSEGTSLLPRNQRDMFYRDHLRWLREGFTHTDIFQRVYALAQEDFMRDDHPDRSDNEIISDLTGAMYEAYGLISMSLKWDNQPGFSFVYGSQLFALYQVLFPDAEVMKDTYGNGLRGVTIPDAVVVAHDTREGSILLEANEITTTNRNHHLRNHYDKSVVAFQKDRDRNSNGEKVIFSPMATLSYFVPKGFRILGKNYFDVEVIDTGVTIDEWKEFMTFLLTKYIPENNMSTLEQLWGIYQGSFLPRDYDTGVVVKRLLYEERPVDELVADGESAQAEEWDRVRRTF